MDGRSYTIGVLGGMGTYATIHLFRQYAEVFYAEEDPDRPRIIIDNRCTLPDRVRASLYGEDRKQLVDEMSESVRNLINSGCDRILLACNTAHLFLSDIYRQVPEAEGKIINIIDVCIDSLCENGIREVFLLASVGTIESGVYQEACKARGISCQAPGEEEYALLKECIGAVKRDQYNDAVSAVFSELIHRKNICILGCTELPVLYEKYRDMCDDVEVYDPVYLVLTQMRKEYGNGYKS